jgi:DnaJ-class molecular chaperone
MDTVEQAAQVIHSELTHRPIDVDMPAAGKVAQIIAQALADADLLADTRCRKCNGTGGTDLGGACCAVCDGAGHRRAET